MACFKIQQVFIMKNNLRKCLNRIFLQKNWALVIWSM